MIKVTIPRTGSCKDQNVVLDAFCENDDPDLRNGLVLPVVNFFAAMILSENIHSWKDSALFLLVRFGGECLE